MSQQMPLKGRLKAIGANLVFGVRWFTEPAKQEGDKPEKHLKIEPSLELAMIVSDPKFTINEDVSPDIGIGNHFRQELVAMDLKMLDNLISMLALKRVELLEAIAMSAVEEPEADATT